MAVVVVAGLEVAARQEGGGGKRKGHTLVCTQSFHTRQCFAAAAAAVQACGTLTASRSRGRRCMSRSRARALRITSATPLSLEVCQSTVHRLSAHAPLPVQSPHPWCHLFPSRQSQHIPPPPHQISVLQVVAACGAKQLTRATSSRQSGRAWLPLPSASGLHATSPAPGSVCVWRSE